MNRIRAWLSAGIVASLGTAGRAQAPMDTEAESKQVKSVIDDTFKAMNARDLDHALAHYADDGQIDSKVAGAKVSKSAYREQVTRAWAKVRHIQGGPDLTEKHEWKMEKRDGSWLIVEASYK